MSSTRRVASALVIALLVPTIMPFVPTAAADAIAPRRVMVEYDDFANVPARADIVASGLEFRYAFKAIPAIVVFGEDADINALRANAHLTRIIEDAPLQYSMQTAIFATNVVDVWADEWWPTPSDLGRTSPSPIEIDGRVIDGTGVTVAVVDSGIQATHPDLFYEPLYVDGVMEWEPKVQACYNIPGILQGNGDNPHCDQSVGHGTHVAGIVAGNAWAARNGLAPTFPNPARPPMGAAPNASLVGMGLGAALNIIDAAGALDYVYDVADEHGIRVATNSWGNVPTCGGNIVADANDPTNLIAKRLVDQKGITVLFSAGNYDNSGATYVSTYTRNPHPGIITVANYDDRNLGTRAGRINSGSSDGCVKPAASGDYIWTWPDVAAPGTAITSTTIPPTVVSGIGVLGYPTQQYVPFYATIDGTSMATPLVAGIVAMMYQANPDITPEQVERIIIETSTQWSDTVSSRGIIGTTMWNADPTRCKVTPEDAAKAEAGDVSVNTKFPSFTKLAEYTDASLYVCRDYRRGVGLVDGYAAVQAAIALRDDQQQETPGIRITSPIDGAEVDASVIDVTGIVDRFATGNAPSAALTATPLSGEAPLDVEFTLAATDADGSIASWTLNFGDGSTPATGTGVPPTTLSHTYTGMPGERTATLTVSDNDALTASVSVDITLEVGESDGRVLWLVGDGTTTVITDPAAFANPNDPLGDRVFGLSPTGNGDLLTKYRTAGVGNHEAPENGFNPTWSTTAPITLTGETVNLVFHADANAAPTCQFAGALFSGDGSVLAEGQATIASPSLGTYTRFVIPFTPPQGTVNGLAVQIGVVGPATTVECNSAIEYAWGTAAVNGRLVLAPGDVGGGPGPTTLTLDAPDSIPTPGLDIVSLKPAVGGAGRLDVTLALAGAPVTSAGGYPALYEIEVDGVPLQLDAASGKITNAISGASIVGANVVVDEPAKEIRARIPALALAALGAKMPYEITARSALVQEDGLVVVDAIGADRSTTVTPLEDPDDDTAAPVPGTDIRKVTVSDETADTFVVTLHVDDLAAATPSTLLADTIATNRFPTGIKQVYSAGFDFAETPTNVITYQVSASRFMVDIREDGTAAQFSTTFDLEVQAAGTINFVSRIHVPEGTWDETANTISWVVPKVQMDVTHASTGQTDATTRGSANLPTAGETLSNFFAETRMWVYAGAGLGPSPTVWDTAAGTGSYTFTGGNALPVAELSASPITGSVPLDVTFSIEAADTDGSVASWTLDFGDATPAATGTGATTQSIPHTYAAAGAYTARLTVRDDAGAITEATQPIVAASPNGERVELFLDGVFETATPVMTSQASPTATWTLPVDLSGLGGIHTLGAKWHGANGALLAQTSVSVELDNLVPTVTITSPSPNDIVQGIVEVAGTAGHAPGTAPAEGGASSFALLPGGGLRATTSYDFETGAEGWTANDEAWKVNGQNVPGSNQVNNQDPTGLHAGWHLQDSYSRDGGFAWYVGDNVDFGLYNPGIVSNLVSPAIDATADTTGTLSFVIAGNVGEGDVMRLQWKEASAATWTTFATIGDDFADDAGTLIWTDLSYPLPAEAMGKSIQLRLRFEAQVDPDAYLKLAWGYLVDDVVVETESTTVTVPGVPQNLAAVAGLGNVALTWLAPANDGGAPVTAYNLYRDGTLIATQPGTTYLDSDVAAGTTYAYTVSAVNVVGEGAQTASVSATPLSDTVEGVLAITSPANGAEVLGTVSFAGTYPSGDGDDTGESDARVVVSVIDSGVNVYHSFFYAGSAIYPSGSEPSAVTPEVLAEMGIDAAHQIELTRTGNAAADYAADAAKWAAIDAQPTALWWFKGTNIIATSRVGGAGDVILPDNDDDAHGTGTTASVLLANPEAIIVFCEGSGPECEQPMFTLPSVDIVSTSYGPPGSVPYALNPIFGWPTTRTHMAASYAGVVEGGKMHFGAADNSPAPAVQDSTAGAWWSIGVTGYDDAAGGHQALSGTLADFAASFTVRVPYCRTSETCMESASGTSFATPTSAGVASKVLLEARRAAGHTGGIVELGDEMVMVAGEGDAITNWELRRALEEAALYDSVATYNAVDGVFETSLPILDPAPWSMVGWGRLAPVSDVIDGALDQLAGAAPVKGVDACAFMTGIHESRHAYYDNNPFSDSFGMTEDAYIHCADSTAPAMSFAPLTRRGEIPEETDDTPALPPYDILEVDISDDGQYLLSTWDMSMIVGDDEVASPEANAAWFDLAFKIGETEYILEAQGDLDAGNVDVGHTATLWGRTVDEIRGEVWSVIPDAPTVYTMDKANNRFTMGVALASVGAQPGSEVVNTWASVWPNTRVGYTVPYDTAPNGATHESQGGVAFGDSYTVAGDDDVDPVAEEVRLSIAGAASVNGIATLDAGTHTWTFDPAGDLPLGSYTAAATYYVDGAPVEGPVSIAFTVTTAEDIVAPIIDQIDVDTTQTTATVSWATDEAATTLVRYGTTTAYGLEVSVAGLTTQHTANIGGLEPGTTYHYQIVSADAAGNAATTTDATFSTVPLVGDRVELFADDVSIGADIVDTLTSDDTWSISVDTSALPEGVTLLTARFRDAEGATADASIHVTVDNLANRAPVVADIPDQVTQEGLLYVLELDASDPDRDALSFSGANLPPGAEFDPRTGALRYAPDYNAAGVFTDVSISVSDGFETVTRVFDLTVEDTPRPPTLGAIADVVAVKGHEISIPLSASDPDGGPLTLTVAGAHADAQLVDNGDGTGVFTWTPSFSVPSGAWTVTFAVSDGSGLFDDQDVNIYVTEPNRPPVIDAIGDQTVAEASTLVIDITASDPDGDHVDLSATGLPEGAAFDDGEFTWTPTYDDAGTYAVTFAATDGEFTAEETIDIIVTHVNRAPVLASIPSKSVDESEQLTFTVSANDPDGDSVTVSAEDLPAGASFDGTTFTWTPTNEQSGAHIVTFTATDGALSDAQEVGITVGDVNRLPELASIGPQTIAEGALLTFLVSGSDPDGDAVTLAASGLPSGASFDSATGAFSWTPSYTQAGDHTMRFTVSDGIGPAIGEDVLISVTNTDRAPVFNAIPTGSVRQQSRIDLLLTASDPDGDAVTFVFDGPAGVTQGSDNIGRPTLRWSPTLDFLGPYEITVHAKSNSLTTTRTTTVNVLFNTSFSVAHETASALRVSPGEIVTVEARITNTGPQTDTFALGLAISELWRHTALPAFVMLAPGESIVVATDVTVPTNLPLSYASIKATSQGDPSIMRQARFRLDVPVNVEVTGFGHITNAIDTPTGIVHVTHLDGTVAVNAVVFVEQMSTTLGGPTITTASGTTDENGEFRFDFSGDPRAMTPGEHQIVVKAKKNGGLETTYVTTYQVGFDAI